MKNFDNRLLFFLKEIFEEDEINIIISSGFDFDKLMKEPEIVIKNLKLLHNSSKDKLLQHVIDFKKYRKLYRNNIINFIKFKPLDLVIIIVLSFLMYFQLINLISDIEIFYNLKAPSFFIVSIGCFLVSIVIYLPLRTFFENNIRLYLFLVVLYIFSLVLAALLPSYGIYISLISFLYAIFLNIIFFQKQSIECKS